MSVLPQELLRKASNHSSAEPQASPKPQKHFHDVLRTHKNDEKASRKDLFSLLAEEEEEEKTRELGAAHLPCTSPLLCSAVDGTISGSSSIAVALPQGLEALFEKMASCMLVMSTSHEVETTLFLDNPHFATSPLFGTQITLREFSTAPKAFNIEILSNPLALAMINAGKNDLLSAFQRGGFNFTVHRFDTHLEQGEQRPVFHRKESCDKEQNGEQGERS